MKIRNGFVSNSSSSSFIIRGIKIGEKQLAESLGISVDQEDLMDECAIKLMKIKSKLEVQSTRYYFDGDHTGEVVIGFNTNVEDGCVIELQDDNERDEKIKAELNKIGVNRVDKLSTFFQYISNDNY